MKSVRKMVMAVTLAASTALAQNEQWLTYHTGTEGRGYHSVKLTTDAPAEMKLPEMKAQPYFAQWQTPMDPGGGRWLCLDRTRKSGPYDRLYIDSNGNGRLDDETPVSARLDSAAALRSSTPTTSEFCSCYTYGDTLTRNEEICDNLR